MKLSNGENVRVACPSVRSLAVPSEAICEGWDEGGVAKRKTIR